VAPYGKKVRGLAKCRYAPVYNSYFDNGLELEFAETLDQDPSVKEWIKNGRNGSEHFAVPVGPDSLFYPDWLVVYADGTLGIYDTKAHGKGGAALLPSMRPKRATLCRPT
jgi:type III restriction enzyme